MKKLFIVAAMAMFTLGSQAQIVHSYSTRIDRVKENKVHPHNIWLDFGAGVFSGDWEDTGVGIDLGVRWTVMFTDYVGWDVIKGNAMTDTKNFGEALNVQFKTGIRGQSPVLFGDSRIYANVDAGYALLTEEAESAFTWEIGVGINVTPRFAVGISYNSLSYSHEYEVPVPHYQSSRYYSGYYYTYEKEDVDITAGYLSLRFSYAF